MFGSPLGVLVATFLTLVRPRYVIEFESFFTLTESGDVVGAETGIQIGSRTI